MESNTTGLKTLKEAFMQEASKLGNYQELSKTDLVECYCDATDAKDEALRNVCISALMLRYWFKIGKTRARNPINLSDEICYDIVLHGIDYALEHRSWQDPTKDVYNDPNGPDKVINQCIESSYLTYMQQNNKILRKANANNYSLEKMIEDNGDCANTYTGCVADSNPLDSVQILVRQLLKKGKNIEALIVDGIANFDTDKDIKATKTIEIVDEEGNIREEIHKYKASRFDARKLVKHLNLVDDEFMNNFCKRYDVKQVFDVDGYARFKKMNNTKLYKWIQKTLLEIKTDADLLSCVQD